MDHYTRKGNLVVGCSGSPMEETIPGYEHFRADVADEDAVKEIIRAVGERYGRRSRDQQRPNRVDGAQVDVRLRHCSRI